MAWNDELKKSRSTSGQTLEGLESHLHDFFSGKIEDEEILNNCLKKKTKSGEKIRNPVRKPPDMY